MKVTLSGKEYRVVIATPGFSSSMKKKKELERRKPKWEPPRPRDLHKEMTKQRVSHHYVTALLVRLASDLQSEGAELMNSDGDRYLSIVSGDAEVLIAPLFAGDEVALVIERLGANCKFRAFGSISIDETTTYADVLDSMRKYVKRAKAT